MADQVAQPTILVKKSDGTTERITLDELKKRQSGAVAAPVAPVVSTPVVVAPVAAPVAIKTVEPVAPKPIEQPVAMKAEKNIKEEPKNVASKIEEPHGVVIGPAEKKTTTPKFSMPKPLEVVIPKIVTPSQEAVVVKQNDEPKIINRPSESTNIKSDTPLLHEEVPQSPHAQTTTVPTRLDQADKIIVGLSFKVPAQFANRLRSAIQLRLKDIRSEADTKDLCLRSIKDGGLGLTETQAQEVITKAKPMVMEIKLKDKAQIDLLPKIELPPTPIVPSQKISKETINKEMIVDKIIGQTSSSPDIADLIPSKPASTSPAPTPVRMSAPAQSQKIQMHDMKAKPASLGPLDEIQYFSLIDLRRLSSQASEAISRLKQKFINLKEESFLLFIDSWSAWRNSGLYQSYMQAVDDALVQKRRLVSVLGEKEKISLAEIEAIIKMEKELEI